MVQAGPLRYHWGKAKRSEREGRMKAIYLGTILGTILGMIAALGTALPAIARRRLPRARSRRGSSCMQFRR